MPDPQHAPGEVSEAEVEAGCNAFLHSRMGWKWSDLPAVMKSEWAVDIRATLEAAARARAAQEPKTDGR